MFLLSCIVYIVTVILCNQSFISIYLYTISCLLISINKFSWFLSIKNMHSLKWCNFACYMGNHMLCPFFLYLLLYLTGFHFHYNYNHPSFILNKVFDDRYSWVTVIAPRVIKIPPSRLRFTVSDATNKIIETVKSSWQRFVEMILISDFRQITLGMHVSP